MAWGFKHIKRIFRKVDDYYFNSINGVKVKFKIKKRWSNYFIELLIVIIGISIAFWINNIDVKNKNELEKVSYLIDIRDDLKKDSLRLSYSIKYNEIKIKKLSKAIKLIEASAPIDSLLVYTSEIGGYSFFSPNDLTLSSLIQSGDLKLINSRKVKKELLRLLEAYETIEYLQKNFLQALDDNYFPTLFRKIDKINNKPIDIDFFYSIEQKNYAHFALNETNQHIQSYKDALKQVVKLIKLINFNLNQ